MHVAAHTVAPPPFCACPAPLALRRGDRSLNAARPPLPACAGACFSSWAVTVVPVGQPNNRAMAMPPQRTTEFSLTISDLTNGQEYRITVAVR